MWKNNVNSQRRADLSADPCSRKHLAGTIISNVNVKITFFYYILLLFIYIYIYIYIDNTQHTPQYIT